MFYIAIVENEDGKLGVWFPDFPGCVSAGNSLEEVMNNGREALAFHVEGMREDGEEIPAPSSLEALSQSGDWQIANNDVIATVPLVSALGKAERVNLSIDTGNLKIIDAEAKRRGLTRSAYMVEASLRELR